MDIIKRETGLVLLLIAAIMIACGGKRSISVNVLGDETTNKEIARNFATSDDRPVDASRMEYISDLASRVNCDLKGVSVAARGQGMMIRFSHGVLFETDQEYVRLEAHDCLLAVAVSLVKFDRANILIEDHTYAPDSDSAYIARTSARALAIARYLIGLEVSADRIAAMGYLEKPESGERPLSEFLGSLEHLDILVY